MHQLQGSVQLPLQQPLCWNFQDISTFVHCKSQLLALSLNIQGPMLLVLSLLQEPLFLLGLQPGESDQKWAPGTQVLPSRTTIYSIFLLMWIHSLHLAYVTFLFNTVCMKELLYPPFWSVGHWGSDGRIQTLKTVTPQAASRVDPECLLLAFCFQNNRK